MTSGLDDATYRRQTRALRALHLPCWLCGQPIDYTLDYRHKNAFTADHITPRSHGGSLHGEIRPAHRGCNSRRSNRITTVTTPPHTKYAW